MKPVQTFNVLANIPDKLAPLWEMAFNLWYCWNYEAVSLFSRIDRALWDKCSHNPVLMLGLLDQDKIEELAADQSFLSHMHRVYAAFLRYKTKTGYYDFEVKEAIDTPIAYFSAEYGLSDAVAIYSGGLGVLSGDHLKSASDLRIPLVAVGLLYQQGYLSQYLSPDGWQQETYTANDFYNMPLAEEKGRDGTPIQVEVPMPGRNLRVKIWRIQVGRVPLFLLDTNVPENGPEDREITAHLYGGTRENRIKQEIVLGMGGVRALRALDIKPSAFHMNEGHSAFAGLERIRQIMAGDKVTFWQAKEAVAASSVFTTHTPVPAGIDMFDPALMERYFSDYSKSVGISLNELMTLGRVDANNQAEPFSMAVLAIRLSELHNGVSRLHSEVSRAMWKSLWPHIPQKEVPIFPVTNGIHIPSWISSDMAVLFDRYLGPGWHEDPDNRRVWKGIDQIPDTELWRTHEHRKERLVAFARRRLAEQLARRGAPQAEIDRAKEVLDPEALTICFARRFATYKRAHLLFSNPQRLAKILGNKERQVQIIIAGKAHPQDIPAKEVIKKIINLIREEPFRRRVVFIEDYDINVARYLVQGCDVWLNNPRRPLEACGTSGMKASANGALNLSVLDGWWVEGYQQDNGWAIGHGEEYQDTSYQDEVEGSLLHALLENEVVPLYYNRARDDIPREWIAMMKRSMRTLCPVFNSHRMVEEYMSRCYVEASINWRTLSANGLKAAKDLLDWKRELHAKWGDLKVLDIRVEDPAVVTVGAEVRVNAVIHLGRVRSDEVRVDLYYGTMDHKGNFVTTSTSSMECQSYSKSGDPTYSGTIPCYRTGKLGFTLRVLPSHSLLVDPLSMGLVLWA